MRRVGLSLLLALALVPTVDCTVRPALAQSAPASDVKLTTRVSPRKVEIGDSVLVQVTALSSGAETPNTPNLKVTGAAEVNGPSVRTELRMFSDGRSSTRQRGLTATWSVTPQKLGKLTIGPGSFQVGGKVVQGETVVVEVVPAGSIPQAPTTRRLVPPGFPDPFGTDPFGFFGGRGMGGDDPFDDMLRSGPVPDELKLERAPNDVAFLRQEVTPRRVVIGEQLMLRLYVYGGRGPFQKNVTTEPTTPDFLSFPIDQDGAMPYRVPIGESTFFAEKLREIALFPLHSGKLTIGGAEVVLAGRGYPATQKRGFVLGARPITVEVVEPPLKGRPAGYVLGDVGSYVLSAEVEPRTIEQGGMIAVTAQLKGVGNVPSHITPPEQNGVEWLEPSIRGEVEPKGTSVGGVRTFRWTVRVDKATDVDLGELSLPYFDPTTGRYEVARAVLGKLTVTPNAAAAKGARNAPQGRQADASTPESSVTIAPRAAARSVVGAATKLTDRPGFFWALLLLPLTVPAFAGAFRGISRVRTFLRTDRRGGGARVAHLLAQARKSSGSDRNQAASAYERALYEAIESGTGLKARGVLRAELPRELERAGVTSEMSLEVKRVIDDLETLRFTGEGSLDELGERIARVSRTLSSRSASKAKLRAEEGRKS